VSVFFRTLMKRKTALVATIVLVVIAGVAVCAPILVGYGPNELDSFRRLRPPDGEHIFGTDNFGRDIFSRIAYGARTSLIGAAGVVTIAMIVGIAFGVSCGYNKRIEIAVMRVVDVLMAFPPLLVALVLVSILGRSMINVIIAVSVPYLTRTTRIVFGMTLKLREEQYVEAARADGASAFRIVFRHIVPNLISPLIVQATFVFAFALLEMAALDFLGLGLPPAVPSWGSMLNEGRLYITNAPWLLLVPGLAIVMSVLSLNIVGDVLRDQLDPHFRRTIEGV
jgi:peptide/nickel transport system permease protein